MATNLNRPPGLNLLSLDGGGIIGLSSLFILREIMDRLQLKAGLPNRPHPWEYFDLIAGSGTGAICAVMLGRLRMSVDETIKAYCHLMSETYPRKKSIVGGDSTVAKTIKLEEGLRAIIGAATGAPEEGMLEGNPNEAKCKVVIYAMPARNANTSPPCAFRTYPTTVSVMPDCPIWKALRASTAHPELFKHIEIEEFGTGYRFTNGSYGCSNPSALLLKEIIALFPGRSVASLVSIGAGHVDTNRIAQSTWLERALPSGGPITPRILRTAHGIVTDNERTAEHMDVSFSRIKNAYYRLNVDAGVQDIQSCEWEKQSQVADGTRVYVQQDEVHKRLGKLVAAVQERPALATIKLDGSIGFPLKLAPAWLKCGQRSTLMFRGHEPQLKKVTGYFANSVEPQHVFVMHGPGGAGKTQTALKFAEQMTGRFEGVIFIDSSSRQAIETTLGQFALSEEIGRSYMDTLEWLGSHDARWLMLFDNVDDPDSERWIHEYFPRKRAYDILITTRHENMVRLGKGEESYCQIVELSLHVAIELLLETARLPNCVLQDAEYLAATRLLQECGYLALAIVQCGAFIRRTQCNFSQYYEIYLQERRVTVESNGANTLNIQSYELSVYTTWVLNAKLVGAPLDQLWQLFIFLHWNGISEQIFRRAYENASRYQPAIPMSSRETKVHREVRDTLELFTIKTGVWSSQIFVSSMAELVSLSLVTYDIVTNAYQLHPIVQKWARGRVALSKPTSVENAAALLALSITHLQSAEDCAFRRTMVHHVHEILALCPTPHANNSWQFIVVYHEIGYRVESLEAQVVDTRERILGKMHPATCESRACLARTYFEHGDLVMAERLEIETLAGQPQISGKWHPYTACGVANLVATYEQRHRCRSANRPSIANTVLGLKEAFKDDHPSVLRTTAQLAVQFHQRGHLTEARALEEEALAVCRQHLGPDHPDTVHTLSNLAITYDKEGRAKEAEALRAEVLASCKQILSGGERSDMLRTFANQAAMCHKRGQLTYAMELKVEVMNASKRILGVMHPNTLQSLASLALTYEKLGLFSEAESLRTETVHGLRQLLGHNHAGTLGSMVDLATVYHKQRQENLYG